MRTYLRLVISAGLVLVTGAAFGQTTANKPSFEVASVKPTALDMMKIASSVQSGGAMPRMGLHVDGSRAEYIWMPLNALIVMAYKVKPYQITGGPSWLGTERFDIVAKLPDGASKDDVPQMLQSLLEDRFKLVLHRETRERPILALVVGKGAEKLQASPEAEDIDENAPLKAGEMKVDGPDGPVRINAGKDGSGTMDMGKKGKVKFQMDQATMAMHMEFSQVTMEGFADMLTQFSQMAGGGGRQVVDMTELKGNYQVSLDIPMGDLMAMAQAQGMGGPGAPGGAAGTASGAAASDPSGSSTLFTAVQALGLKLEQRKAAVEQLVIDHIEKTPTEN
jgi:uncharacterized protein (TIGR03435 family)